MLETDWMREIEGLSFSGCFIFMEAGNKLELIYSLMLMLLMVGGVKMKNLFNILSLTSGKVK